MSTMYLHRLLLQIPNPFAMPDSIPSRKEEIEMLKAMPVDEFLDKVVSSLVTFTINLAIAVLVFYVGKFVIGKIHRLLVSIFYRRHVDKSLSTFVISLVRMLLYFLLVVTVIGILGIETSSFIALFASAGVAIGMALSGTLQNFAGGVLILILKPYRVGDYIEVQGYAGTVKEIQIFNTIITTPDNKSIIVPNGGLSTGTINNYSRESYRRVDWTVSISYGDSVADARKAILDILLADQRVVRQYIEDDCPPDDPYCGEEGHQEISPEEELRSHGKIYWRFHSRRKRMLETLVNWNSSANKKMAVAPAKVDRSPVVMVSAMADSSVNLTVRCWTHNSTFWPLYFAMNEAFYTELPKHGIHFPFPQMDVHLSTPGPDGKGA